jgi:hypothetical protein
VAVSRHADTPAKNEPVTAGSATPYTTPVDVNVADLAGGDAGAIEDALEAAWQLQRSAG